MAKTKTDTKFEIVKGFNLADGDSEKRYEPGKRKPHYVSPDDFDAVTWAALIKAEAVIEVTE